jgi:hypothetical protein
MDQVLSGRPVTAEARLRSQVSLHATYSGQSGSGTELSPSASVFLVSIIAPILLTLSLSLHTPCRCVILVN